MNNKDEQNKVEEGDEEELDREESKVFRGVATRLKFMSLDCPDMEFPVKQCSREMAKPKRGSWKSFKKVARYLVGRTKVVWEFTWQEEAKLSYVLPDSDWGGNKRDRKCVEVGESLC